MPKDSSNPYTSIWRSTPFFCFSRYGNGYEKRQKIKISMQELN
jgi:hypothetical protein